jgi:hypothetical protein
VLAALLGHDESPPDVIRRLHTHLRGRKRRKQADSNSPVGRASSSGSKNSKAKNKKKKKGGAKSSSAPPGSGLDKKRKGFDDSFCSEDSFICDEDLAAASPPQDDKYEDEVTPEDMELYWETVAQLCGGVSRAPEAEDLMTSQETLKVRIQRISFYSFK